MRIAEENWKVLASLFPLRRQQIAWPSGAIERLRGFPSPDTLLRTLLLHVARGYSLRETLYALSRRTGPTFRMLPCSSACATARSGCVCCVSNCFGKTSRTGSKKLSVVRSGLWMARSSESQARREANEHRSKTERTCCVSEADFYAEGRVVPPSSPVTSELPPSSDRDRGF